ncbi:MAG: hypothetical protein L0154_09205, partial [Chloroflexi bacterium]|nr:hypothetical protein [Chloroflexota bacterium]
MFDWRIIHLNIDEQHSLGNILETISLDRLRSSLHMIRLYISIDEGLLDIIRPFIREISTNETPRTGMNSIKDEFTRELFEKLSSYDPRVAYSIYSYIQCDFSTHAGISYDMRTYLLITKNVVTHLPDTLASWPLSE